MISDYVTEQNLRLLVIGAGASALAMAVLGLFRRSPRWLTVWTAPVLGLFAIGGLDWPHPPGARVLAAGVAGLAAGRGYEVLARSRPRALPVLALLAAVAGVWLGVPENSYATVLIGVVLGVVVIGLAAAPGAGYALGLSAAWSALAGAYAEGFSFDGGLLCLVPLAAIGVLDVVGGRHRGLLPAWPWFVAGAGAVSWAAARWIAVAPDASWTRIGIVAGAAVVLAGITRR